MAANPNPSHQHPRETPNLGGYGQRARPTVPMAPREQPALQGHWERRERALSALTQVQLRDPCWRCGGTGFVDRPYMQCDDPTCGKAWTDEQVARHMHRGWRKPRTLPCGHPLPNKELVFFHAQCPTCTGSPVGNGYLPAGTRPDGWVSLAELLPVLVELLEEYYAEISAEITAHTTQVAPGDQQKQQPPNSF